MGWIALRRGTATVVAAACVLGAAGGAGAQPSTVTATLPGVAPISDTADPVALEAEFVTRINDERAAVGAAPLSVDDDLVEVARSWAHTMATAGEISHATDISAGVGAPWSKLGENVGVGDDVATLHAAFTNSESHFANIADPAYTHIGVGVVVTDNRIFTVHRFMALADEPPSQPATPSGVHSSVVATPVAARSCVQMWCWWRARH